jgi:hypothetical protein
MTRRTSGHPERVDDDFLGARATDDPAVTLAVDRRFHLDVDLLFLVNVYKDEEIVDLPGA